MIRNQAGAMDASGKVTLFCATCNHRTQRVFNDERDGFGVCRRCGGALRRAGSIAADRRAEKAKRELQGGPIR